jgi:hypothetical protein
MRKEVIFAIFAGIMLGLLVAFGIWRADNALKPAVDTNLATNDNPQYSTTTANSSKNSSQQNTDLAISSIESGDVFTENPVILKGLTHPNVNLVISTENDDFLLNSDATGQFEKEIALTGGINNILITAYDNKGFSSSTSLKIVFSSEFASAK